MKMMAEKHVLVELMLLLHTLRSMNQSDSS